MAKGELLWQLGVEPRHYDGMGRYREPSWDTLYSVLGSLGLRVGSPEELPAALADLQGERSKRLIEPFVVGWEGRASGIQLRLENGGSGSPVDLTAVNEEGAEFRFRLRLETGEDNSCWIHCPESLAPGYYRIEVQVGSRSGESCLIVAPNRAFGARSDRTWGLFCPLYAIHSGNSLGSGDYTDLGKTIEWMAEKGGRMLGSLPLFAAFLDSPCEPSPYAPLSRLFWNEFYLDPRQTCNWGYSSGAGKLFDTNQFQNLVSSLRSSSQVDFRTEMKLRRSLLQLLSDEFFTNPDPRGRNLLENWVAENPEVMQYARFRAGVEQNGIFLDSGEFERVVTVESGDLGSLVKYHLYTQWQTDIQVNRLGLRARERDVDLYMDLPLGVHPDGYDAWAYRDFFAEGVSGGAPPDAFFTAGQDWGFRPMHPWKSAESEHLYFRKILGNLMGFSDVIRLDHVMNLHRLYWVPIGMAADQGAYVRYPANDLYAILMLESHRHECAVVGEDLGTVPPEVRETMDEHGVMRMFVGQFEVDPGGEPRLRQPEGNMVASVNTHDTPTFSGFSKCLDILDRVDLGILEEAGVEGEKESRCRLLRSLAESLGFRYPGEGEEWNECLLPVLKNWLLRLAESPARYLLVNLEDLWLEDSPQNVPGTTEQKPNWRQKMKLSLEEICADPFIGEILDDVNRRRKG